MLTLEMEMMDGGSELSSSNTTILCEMEMELTSLILGKHETERHWANDRGRVEDIWKWGQGQWRLKCLMPLAPATPIMDKAWRDRHDGRGQFRRTAAG